ATWTDITKAPLPDRWISAIAVDPNDPDIVYASFSGFSSATPSAPGHIFRSRDAGATWSRFDSALGELDTPVDYLITHPLASDVIYAATDYGIAVTTDGGCTWERLGQGLPEAPNNQILFQERSNRLLAATHGRSVWGVHFAPRVATDRTEIALTAREG